jgi:tetratricopeptide (TPR) repeat protein
MNEVQAVIGTNAVVAAEGSGSFSTFASRLAKTTTRHRRRSVMRILALSLVVVGLLVSPATARIWTDATGKGKVDAEYLGMENGQVKLKFNRTGKITLMPLSTLSQEDQQFVNEAVARAEAEKEAAEGPADRFTEAIKAAPTDPVAYINRGMARTNRKDFDGAIKDFTKAIELNPEDAQAYNGRGLAYQRKGDLISAQRDFNESIRRSPDMASAYRNRGENLYKLALDKKQSVPELDEAIEKWEKYWNFARKGNLKNTPWQPLNATKGDVSRPAALRQMAKIDLEFAENLEREYGGYHRGGVAHGGHHGHGPGCACEACSGTACPHCDGKGCAACGGGKPAPGLGVYPEKVLKGQMVTLVANASQLAKGMPAEAKPGDKKAAANGPKIPVESVDFYRDVDGDGLFSAEADQYLASDSIGSDGFTAEVSTASFPPGPQSYFAVGRGKPGSGSGATPEELLSAAQSLEEAAAKEKQIADACESCKTAGLPAEQSKTLGQDQASVAKTAAEVGEKIAAAAPEVAKLLEDANKPITAAKNRLATAEKRPGEPSAADAQNAAEKASEAASKMAEAAKKLREAYEAAKASSAANPGQAPANAAVGTPNSGANEVILANAPVGPGPGGPGPGGNDDGINIVINDKDDAVNVADRALDLVDDHNYDRAVEVYDRLVDYDPNNVDYLRDRAATQLLRGGYDYAIRDYDRLVELKTEPDANLYYNRGCAHLASGRYDAALSDFTKSISLNETWSLAYNNRGTTYARLGDYDKAIEDFTAAIRLEPANRLAYRNRALAFKKLGEVRKAQADFEVVLRLEKEAPGTSGQ